MIEDANDLHPHALVELEAYRAGASIRAVLSIRNTSQSERVELVKYAVPSSGHLDNDVFSIATSRGPAHYLGRLVKRPPPTEADYVFLAPGRGMRWEVDLSAYYETSFAASTVVYQAFHPTLAAPLRVWRLRSNVVTID